VELLDPEHVAAIAVTAAVAVAAVRATRARPELAVPLSRGLAVTILCAYVAESLAIALRGTWSLERNLPLHLTDAVTIVSVLALLTVAPLLFELTYFWGLTASLQATLTPDLGSRFPSLLFFTYFLTHGGAVVAAIFLAWGRGLVPRRGAVWRALGATIAFAALAGIGDLLTGGNYMFLREKPGDASLLDVMGPWPWYILTGAAVALAMFAALDALARRRPGGSAAGGRMPGAPPARS
jgi:hypothetical integral membrane protein (TIGR02206 family)